MLPIVLAILVGTSVTIIIALYIELKRLQALA
ncbi:hypothetical protein LB507_011447 [Fusarium sp. FIESC RH6]|nr:hypothetical protein LB507_011447 [Fusarium sp. FIESC RH6]